MRKKFSINYNIIRELFLACFICTTHLSIGDLFGISYFFANNLYPKEFPGYPFIIFNLNS